jgi:hypothetical protein
VSFLDVSAASTEGTLFRLRVFFFIFLNENKNLDY